MKKVAITGSNGFVGTSLNKKLKDQFQLNLLSYEKLSDESLIRESLKDTPVLLHLAGISSVGDCEKNITEAYKVNVGLSCAMAEIFFRLNKGGHFIFTSTGQVYDEKEPVPHRETTKIAPGNTYARTKLCAELSLSEIARLHEGRLTLLRMYNHTHKSQSSRFVLPSILKQIQESTSNVVHLKVGNIEVDRDFSAIQDLIRALSSLFQHRQEFSSTEVYNLGSGVGKNLRQLIFDLAARFGKKVEFEIEPTLLRANDPKRVIGDSSKFQTYFQWQSQSQSISDFLDFFLEDL